MGLKIWEGRVVAVSLEALLVQGCFVVLVVCLSAVLLFVQKGGGRRGV